jgi:hypothetical protein
VYVCVSFIHSQKSLETYGTGEGYLIRNKKYIRFIKCDVDDDDDDDVDDDNDDNEDDDDDDDYQG